jgi:hypothetical protein
MIQGCFCCNRRSAAARNPARSMPHQVRDFVRKNADRLFEKLEKEEDKRAGSKE